MGHKNDLILRYEEAECHKNDFNLRHEGAGRPWDMIRSVCEEE